MFLHIQRSTTLLQSGQHDEMERVMKDLERQQQLEREAAEAGLDAEESEHIKHVTQNANEDVSKGVKDAHRNILLQVKIKNIINRMFYMSLP